MKALMDVARLVEEVKSRPPLYNPAQLYHRDQEKAIEMWEEIGQILGVNGDEAKARWKGLRDTYVRKKRQIKHGVHKPTGINWRHLETMSFLDPFVHAREHTRKTGGCSSEEGYSVGSFKERGTTWSREEVDLLMNIATKTSLGFRRQHNPRNMQPYHFISENFAKHGFHRTMQQIRNKVKSLVSIHLRVTRNIEAAEGSQAKILKDQYEVYKKVDNWYSEPSDPSFESELAKFSKEENVSNEEAESSEIVKPEPPSDMDDDDDDDMDDDEVEEDLSNLEAGLQRRVEDARETMLPTTDEGDHESKQTTQSRADRALVNDGQGPSQVTTKPRTRSAVKRSIDKVDYSMDVSDSDDGEDKTVDLSSRETSITLGTLTQPNSSQCTRRRKSKTRMKRSRLIGPLPCIASKEVTVAIGNMVDKFVSFQREFQTRLLEFEERRIRLEHEWEEKRRHEQRQHQLDMVKTMIGLLTREKKSVVLSNESVSDDI